MMEWYVLQVITGKETAVVQLLEGQHLEALAPIEGRMIHTHGKWVEMDYTLLPGYVFVHATMDDTTYYLLQGIAGILRILSSGGSPSPLSPAEVDWLQCINGCQQEPTTVEYLDNHTYRIVSGFLKSRPGCIEHIDRHRRRIRIKLQLLGKTKQLELSYRVATP